MMHGEDGDDRAHALADVAAALEAYPTQIVMPLELMTPDMLRAVAASVRMMGEQRGSMGEG